VACYLGALILLWAAGAQGDETAIRATECSKMAESAPTTAYGSDTFTEIGNWAAGDTKNPIIQFDISSIPAGNTVSAATLWVFNISLNALGTFNAEVAAVKQNWVETQVTWNIYSTANSWATGGAEGATDRYTPEDTASASDASASDSISFDVTDMVSNWHESVWTNNGLMINPVDAPVTEYYRFYSDDEATVVYRPLLIVTHAAAASGANLTVKGNLVNKGNLKVGN